MRNHHVLLVANFINENEIFSLFPTLPLDLQHSTLVWNVHGHWNTLIVHTI